MTHDPYRPASLHRIEATLDERGLPRAWHHRIAGPSINDSRWPGSVEGGLDSTAVSGAADLPYAIPEQRVDYTMVRTPVPVGFWRSVGFSANTFVTESFIDELAVRAGRDPVAYRLALLEGRERHARVLEAAAEHARWGNVHEAQGVALQASFGAIAAQVATVEVDDDGRIRVPRVVCVIDLGRVVNPALVESQVEGSIAFALTATLKSAVTLEDGRVQQHNFDGFPLLRMDEMPEVEVLILDSAAEPGGAGEPGVPPLAPAVANAVFAASGHRLRALPFTQVPA
jgi:isoquinoline 1-oxidoreductase beta subunit